MHNGVIAGFSTMKRDLAMAVDPALFSEIEGPTDSEMLFYLALTHGLLDGVPTAVAKAVGLVEEVARHHRIADPVQMTIATTDGDTTWAFRYSSVGFRSLFRRQTSRRRHQYPDNPGLHDLAEDARLVVSEPLGDLHGAWQEVPEASCLIVHGAQEELRPFAPMRASI